MVDHDTAKPGADGIAEIEGGDVEARSEALAGASAFSSTHICNGGTVAKAAAPSRPTKMTAVDLVVDGEGHQQEHHRQRQQAAEQRRHQPAVGKPSAEQIAGHEAAAEHQQDRRHRGFGEAGDLVRIGAM